MSPASALPRQEPASPAMLRAPIAMTKWRGHSGCTYVAVIHDLNGEDLATIGECVVLGAARTSSGVADLFGAAVSSATAARTWRVETGGNVYLRAPAFRIGATPDAYAVDPERAGRGVVQVKTTSDLVFRKKWRDEAGEIVLPLWIAVQAIVEARLTGASWACVALLVVGHGLDLHVIEVPLHAGIWTRLTEEAPAFWARVASGEPPAADYARDGDTIADLWPPDAAAAPLDLSGDNHLPALLDERETISARAKADKERLDAIKAEITAKLAGATAAQLADGRVITRTLQSRAEHTVKASTFPVIRIKAARKAAA